MQAAFQYIRISLANIYPENEINSISYLLLTHVTGLNRTGIILNKNTIISDNQRQKLEFFVNELISLRPIQYVLGTTEFYGFQFKVDESVLIPRPETEELVDWICSSADLNSPLSVLDIGTGSGCIAISLKSIFKKSIVTAVDISQEALHTATQNAKDNGCEVIFKQMDVLQFHSLPEKYNIIVSNPPYIPNKEKVDIEAHVLDFEPHSALFVPDADPLLFYRKIASLAKNDLYENGFLFFEIHRDFGQQTMDMLSRMGFKSIVLKKDIAGNDRMIRAVK